MDPTLCRKLFQWTESLALWRGDAKCQEQIREVTKLREVERRTPSMSNSTLKFTEPCNPLAGCMNTRQGPDTIPGNWAHQWVEQGSTVEH